MSNTSLNWTSVQNKWITPPKDDIRPPNLQINKPIHSTPALKDQVKKDLHVVFNNISKETDNTEKSRDCVFPLNDIVNITQNCQVETIESQEKASTISSSRELEGTTILPPRKDKPE